MSLIRTTKLQNLKDFSVSLVEKNDKKYYNILDNKGQFLFIQTPYLQNPFSITDYKDNKKYGLTLNVSEDEYKIFENFKDNLLQKVFNNEQILKDTKKKIKNVDVLESLFYFPTKMNEVEENKYFSVKVGFNSDYEDKDMLKLNVFLQKEKVQTRQVKELNEMLGLRNTCLYVLKPSLYVVGGNIGVTFKVELMKMKEDARDNKIIEKMEEISFEVLDDE